MSLTLSYEILCKWQPGRLGYSAHTLRSYVETIVSCAPYPNLKITVFRNSRGLVVSWVRRAARSASDLKVWGGVAHLAQPTEKQCIFVLMATG